MRSVLSVVLGAVAAFGMACGGSNPGGGTKTLYVEAEAVSDGLAEGTYIAVQVRDGSSSGTVLGTDVIVKIRGDHTDEFLLPWQGFTWGGFSAGAHAMRVQWDTGWAISVRRGNDGLDGYLVVPGHTAITQPIEGTAFNLADQQPLLVKWEDDAGHRAETVAVELHQAQLRRELSEDPLQLSIPFTSLQPTDERVEVTRTNEINLAGGTPGSVFRATTHHSISFVVQ